GRLQMRANGGLELLAIDFCHPARGLVVPGISDLKPLIAGEGSAGEITWKRKGMVHECWCFGPAPEFVAKKPGSKAAKNSTSIASWLLGVRSCPATPSRMFHCSGSREDLLMV